MKRIALTLISCLVLTACGETKKNENQKETKEVPKKETTSKTLPSGDYSSLLVNYECDISVGELTNALNIPEADISMPKPHRPGQCGFVIKGFGENQLGDETPIIWFLEELGKAQIQKEIKSYLDAQANSESVLGMGIELSETGDSYIARQPMHGRVAIMNPNYDKWLLLSYSPKHSYKSRTQQQHDVLGAKMVDLANYLLEKHKK